jgi:hydroxyacylglutathione hydrolase
MNVTAVPMLKDNLGYLVTCQSTGAHFFVDISHHSAAKFIAACEQHDALKPGLTVFTTHKHSDHAGGNEEARLLFQKRTGASLIVYGDSGIDKTPGISRGINDGESVTIGDLTVRAIQTPCHTRGSMCYHVISKDPSHPGCMFTGDTLFPGGVLSYLFHSFDFWF